MSRRIYHALACDRAVHDNRETLSGVLVEYGHQLDRATVFGRVEEKVIAPHVVGIQGFELDGGVLAGRDTTAFTLFPLYLQARLAPETMQPFRVDLPVLTLEQGRDAPVAKAWVFLGQFMHPACQRSVPLVTLCVVALGRTRLAEHKADPALTHAETLADVVHGRPLARRAQYFPWRASWRMSLSSESSATSFLSRVFCFSSSLRRLSWSRRMPPYWRFQR